MATTMLVGCGDSVATGGGAVTNTAEPTETECKEDEIENSEKSLSTSEDEENMLNRVMSGKAGVENQNTEAEISYDEIEERRWMIVSVEQYSTASTYQEGFVEYDELGRISLTDFDFFNFIASYNTVLYYEYEDDEEFKITSYVGEVGGKVNNVRWYALDEQGRLSRCSWDANSGKNYDIYTYLSKPEPAPYAVTDETYNCIRKFYVKDELDGTDYLTRDYSQYKIEQFAVPLYFQGHAYEITIDDYGNPIRIRNRWHGPTRSDSYFVYFTYAYCTLEEYFGAKETGNFDGLELSRYEWIGEEDYYYHE